MPLGASVAGLPVSLTCPNPPPMVSQASLPGDVTTITAAPDQPDTIVQLLIDDVDGAVDLGVGRAELMRNQLHQQNDPLDEKGRAAGDRARGR